MPNELPIIRLDDSFFAVCSTAIQHCAWEYKAIDTVKKVEGQLAALHAFYIEFYKRELLEKNDVEVKPEPVEIDQGIKIEPIAPVMPNAPIIDKVPVISSNSTSQNAPQSTQPAFATPTAAKAAPIIPMPDDILEIVKAGVDVAKTAPKFKDNVEATDMPAATTPEEVIANVAKFKDTKSDIAASLKPGERFLTEEEAAENRKKIAEARKEKGLGVFD